MEEEQEILIKVEGLSKKFCKDLKTSLWYGLQDLVTNISGNKKERLLRDKEFWALKDINFELRRGECLGLIGHNGAGKSTLLKILNGLIKPDSGRVTIKGKVGALIELGAGFNPILTGRENIYNNGAVLGFTRREIKEKIEEIIDFAEIREFIDMPVQNYSSGMNVRLGFAIAAQMEPDVLIIDEVLAVGDISFRAKCYKRISELMKKCCILFVSHSMPQISRICNRAILLNRGEVIQIGKPGEIIENYYEITDPNESKIFLINEDCHLLDFQISQTKIFNFQKKLNISIKIESSINIPLIDLNIVFMSRELVPVLQLSSKILGLSLNLNSGFNFFEISLKDLNLNGGIYNLNLVIFDHHTGEHLLWVQNVLTIKILGEALAVAPVLIEGHIKRKQ